MIERIYSNCCNELRKASMQVVKIEVYRSQSSHTAQMELVKTLEFSILSKRKINATKAASIIKRELPEFSTSSRVIVIPTERGWQASRTLSSNEKCHYHYLWEYAILLC